MTITGDYLVLFLGFLALGLTAISLKVTLILFRVAASISWLVLGILFLTGAVGVGLSDPWSQALGFVFLVMTIAPLTLQMVTEVKRESSGKSWAEWSRRPVEEEEPRDMKVKREHRERIRAARERRRP